MLHPKNCDYQKFEKGNQDKCCMDKCYFDKCHLSEMTPQIRLRSLANIQSVTDEFQEII